MARLPEDSTSRCFVDYVSGGSTPVEHTVLLRYNSNDRAATDAQQRLANLLTALPTNQLKQGWRVIRVRTALQGENFTTPQNILPALAAYIGTNGGVSARTNEAVQVAWVGRGVNSPRRVFLSLFGWFAYPGGPTFRWTVGQSGAPSWVDNTIAALRAPSSPLVAVDGTPVNWYSYVNVQYNSYWERRLRVS